MPMVIEDAEKILGAVSLDGLRGRLTAEIERARAEGAALAREAEALEQQARTL